MTSGIIPRPEYPRPDFQRKDWLNLNGEWAFEFDDNKSGEADGWYRTKELSKKINVPFCYQSELSGINDKGMHEVIWYKKEFKLPESFWRKKVLLNFGAVDYEAKVWVNGEYAGGHKGGHVSFKIDITGLVKKDKNTIVVKVEDSYKCTQPRGKQNWLEKPFGCWYTPTSGIWQTVWLETTGDTYLDRVRITPNIDDKNLLVEVFLNKPPINSELSMEIKYKEEFKKKITVSLSDRISRCTVDLKEEDYVDETHYWTPEAPNLYDIKFTLAIDGKVSDEVDSYFGMRKISIMDNFIFLNNKPYYQKLVLDQGYWPESLLTPPSDEAIKFDIEMTKKYGFNGARKHQKIEDPRYYYWADKLGLLVWGEMPSGYDFNTEEIESITREWTEFINRDYNHPCIVTWVPLNESWGVRNIIVDKNQQNFALSLYHYTKAMDATRLVSTNDGWEQVNSDICAIHDYVAWGEEFTLKYANREEAMKIGMGGRLPYANGFKYSGQPVIISEYGGIAFEDESSENWGYNGAVKDEESFLKRYESITAAIRKMPYMWGYCYTQLTDVMQEVNGLMGGDRKSKVDPEKVREINSK